MRITICGGGNAAHTMAALLGQRADVEVRVYAPYGDEAQRWQEGIAQQGGILAHTPWGDVLGHPALVTPDAAEAARDADLVLLALPAFAHRPVLEALLPHTKSDAWLAALPARNGFLWEVEDVFRGLGREPGGVIVGFQTLPWACRVRSFGREVDVLGVKRVVDVAVWPAARREEVARDLSGLLGVPLAAVPSFLALGLADVGQIIHPGIMYGTFRDWDGTPFDEPPLFYQGMDEATAAILDAMSNEVLRLRDAIKRTYPHLDLSAVRHVGEWIRRTYGESIRDDSTLHRCFVTNESYRGIRAPVRAVDGGYVPDFQARYLSEDVPFGLLVTRGIAELVGVPTPTIDAVITWAQEKLGKEYLRDGRVAGKDVAETRAPQRFGHRRLQVAS